MPMRGGRILGWLVFIATGVAVAADEGAYRVDARHAACFRPHGPSCAEMIAGAFDRAEHAIFAEVYQFTEPTIGEALFRAQERGIAVRLIIDRTTVGRAAVEQASRIRSVRVDCTVRIHHDKVAIIDGRFVITGSYNWSVNAERHNDENVLLVENPSLAATYAHDFEAQWQRAAEGMRCP